jgi:hypothetical protein
MIISIALLSYLLPPQGGERIGVLITSLLVFLGEINGSLPRNSDSVPVIKVFYMVTMGECALCFLTTCLAIRLLEKDSKKKLPFRIPIWVKRYLLRMKQKQMRLNQLNGHPNMTCEMGSENEIFTLKERNKNITSREEDSETPDTAMELRRKSNPFNFSKSVNINSRKQRIISDDIIEKSGIEKDANEMTWEMFVEYLDKLCIYILSLLFLITTVAILMPAYYRKYY